MLCGMSGISGASPHDLRQRGSRNGPHRPETRSQRQGLCIGASASGFHVTKPPHHGSHLNMTVYSRNRQTTFKEQGLRSARAAGVGATHALPSHLQSGPQCAAHSLSFGAQPLGFKPNCGLQQLVLPLFWGAWERAVAGAAACVSQWAVVIASQRWRALSPRASMLQVGRGFTD
jgi:hypothetical protein